MTIQGFLDFQEGTIWQSDIAFSDSSQNQVTGTTVTFPASGSYVCSNWQSTQIRCLTISQVFDFTAQWFTDAAGVNQIGERRWSVYNAWPLPTYLTVGNLGPYLRIKTSNFSGGTGSAFFRGVFANRALGPFQPAYSTPYIHRSFAAVLGAANIVVLADYLYAGPATLAVNTDSNEPWTVVGQGFTSDGTIYDVAAVGALAGGQQKFTVGLTLPPIIGRVQIFNDGAAAHNWAIGITADVFR